MARPGSRQQLIDYCLRKLGEPVIEINVDPDQMDDRVDEAIQYFIEYHNEGVRRAYVSHQITSEDLTNDYITVSDDIVFVSRVLPLGDTTNTNFDMFDASYQMMFDAITRGFNIAGDLAYYEQMQQHLSLLDMKLNGTPQINWSRYDGKIRFFGDTNTNDIQVGDHIVMEVFKEVRPSGTGINSTIYDNMFLKEFTTALIKQQWGINLIKFEGMQLPGGVTINGRQYYDDATAEIEALKERLRLEYEEPVDFFVG